MRKKKAVKGIGIFDKKLVLILIATLFMNVAYANITSIKLEIEGTTNAQVQEGVFISDIKKQESSGIVSDEIVYYRKTALSSTIEFSSNTSSTIKYAVSFYNNSVDDYYFKGISYDEHGYDNNKITVSINEEIKPYITTIHAKSALTIFLEFKYVDGANVTGNQILNSLLNFDFSNEYIEFSVAKQKYTAPNGITWEQFVESEYNTDSFTIKDEKVYTSKENVIIGTDAVPVKIEDVISKDIEYNYETIEILLEKTSSSNVTQGTKVTYTMNVSSTATVEAINLQAEILNSANKKVGTATISKGSYKVNANTVPAKIEYSYTITVDTSVLSIGTYKIRIPEGVFKTTNGTVSTEITASDKFTVISGSGNTISGGNTIIGGNTFHS